MAYRAAISGIMAAMPQQRRHHRIMAWHAAAAAWQHQRWHGMAASMAQHQAAAACSNMAWKASAAPYSNMACNRARYLTS